MNGSVFPNVESLARLLGQNASSNEITEIITRHSMNDVFEDPPFRRYVGSKSKGINLLFHEGHLIDIQVRVSPSEKCSAFDGELPFGLKPGMDQVQVHKALGPPIQFDEIDSKYIFNDPKSLLTICYDRSSTIRYISIALP